MLQNFDMGMRNDVQKAVQGGGGGGSDFIPTSFKALSSYFRYVSSGASTVASTVKSAASAASAMVDRESESVHDQVQWAGFDKLEYEGGLARLVLLVGYRHGFQVWDVEDDNNMHNIVSRQDGPVSLLQLLPKPLASKPPKDKFAESRPLLILCADGCFNGGNNYQERLSSSCDGTIQNDQDLSHGCFLPTVVWFYSLRSHSYVHQLKFRSVVHMVRCSSRVIAVLQAAQIHCFDAATLEKDYTILTNPVVVSCESGGLGFGPLAVGPRWMAYSGSPVDVPNFGRVSPQQLTPSASFRGTVSNGSLVARYAKESTKQIAAGIVNLGDMGYKKLSRYCSELMADGSNAQVGNPRLRMVKAANGQFHDVGDVGMVIVRDTVQKTVVTQFRAHKSPISSLCFDPSGLLLVTASVQGHNINVFRIIPGCSENSSGAYSGASYIHLYRLQRGFTNAVIQDISFSTDSEWILISSSRGTSHLFAISPFGGSDRFQFADAHFAPRGTGLGSAAGPTFCGVSKSGAQFLNQLSVSSSTGPIALSVVSRIRSGSNGWRQTVSGAAAAAAGRMKSFPVAVAAAFHNFNGSVSCADTCLLKENDTLLVFSSPGFLTQHAWRVSSGLDFTAAFHGVGAYESGPDTDARIIVEAIRKWNICHKRNCKQREENIDIYGENGTLDSNKIFPEGLEKPVYAGARGVVSKDKPNSEERYYMFIAEAELHMHDHQIPLWAKTGIQFQSLVRDGTDIDWEGVGGEIEIERIPVRVIEANSKELVPVFDYLQASKSHSGSDGQLLHHKRRVSEGSKLSTRSSSGSLESLADGNYYVPNDFTKTGGNGFQMPVETNVGYVNNDQSSETNVKSEIVNSRENCGMEMQHKIVNNNIACQKEENHVADGDDMFI